MVECQDRSVVLMSIHPHWAGAIMDGRKQVEFRRANFSRPISHVVVYATSPVRRVLGYFEVAGVTSAEPEALWRQFADVGGIEAEAFRGYFEEAERGVAISVGKVRELSAPVELTAILPFAAVPQSFCYADVAVIPELDRLA
jgi:predicted transcriptional regulator